MFLLARARTAGDYYIFFKGFSSPFLGPKKSALRGAFGFGYCSELKGGLDKAAESI